MQRYAGSKTHSSVQAKIIPSCRMQLQRCHATLPAQQKSMDLKPQRTAATTMPKVSHRMVAIQHMVRVGHRGRHASPRAFRSQLRGSANPYGADRSCPEVAA